jgi:hypothetical protein
MTDRLVYLVQQTEDYHGPHTYSVHATLGGAQTEARRLAAEDILNEDDAATAEWIRQDTGTDLRGWHLATERYRDGRDLTWRVIPVKLQA